MTTATKLTEDITAPVDLKVKPGYKNTKLGWIPEDWEIVRLEEVGKFSKGKGISKSEIVQKGFPCMRYADIYTLYNIYTENLNFFVGPASAQKSKKISFGDILFAGSGETLEDIGKCVGYLGDEEAYAGGDIIIFTPHSGDTKFLSFALNSEYSRKQKYKSGQGHSVVHIYSSGLQNIKILFPPKDEQKRIAGILSQWDIAIAKLNQLIQQKKFRQKGLTQQLLSGKKRLPGFNGEWKEEKFKAIANRVNRKNSEGNDNVVTISAQRGFVKQEDFFKKRVASKTLLNYTLVHKGEYCYNKSYSQGYPMGAFKRLDDFDKAVVTTLYICFSLKDRVNSDFINHYFEAGKMISGLMRVAQEGGRAHGLLNIGLEDFFNLTVKLPVKEEQKAIAKVLNTADQEINLLKEKLQKLKTQKKGLMQVLLTGKKRLIY